MNNFTFWQRWLISVSFGTVGFGLYMAVASGTHLFDLFNAMINPYFFGNATLSEPMQNFQSWTYGVCGTVMASWGILFLYMALFPFKQKEKSARNFLLAAVLFWYISDTSISLWWQVTYNAAGNTILLILYILPILFTWKLFNQNSSEGTKESADK